MKAKTKTLEQMESFLEKLNSNDLQFKEDLRKEMIKFKKEQELALMSEELNLSKNDYGMPVEEVVRRLHNFMDSPQHNVFLKKLCNVLIIKLSGKGVVFRSEPKWIAYKRKSY